MDASELIAELELKIRPYIERRRYDGGYNCCGCPTYDLILDDVERVIRGEEPEQPRRAWDSDTEPLDGLADA